MKKLFKKLALMVVALLTFSVGSNYTVKEVKAASYVESSFGEGKLFITTVFDGTKYYLPATTTSSGPLAKTYTDVNSIGEDHLWTVTAEGSNWYIQNSAGKYLYTTNANNGVRVGDTANAWKYDASANSFQDTATSRFLGIYNATNWRCYTTVNQANYKESSTSFTFFKADTGAASVNISGDSNAQIGDTIELEAVLSNISGNITWSSSNEEVATVENGIVIAKAMGTTTITADVNGTKGTKEIAVYPVANTELTISEALAVCKLTGNANAPYIYSVTGTVESIDTPYDSGYGNISVTITDGTDSILVYRLKGGNDLYVGVEITVTGTLINFGGNTPEFTSGATYVINEIDYTDIISTFSTTASLGFDYSLTYEEREVESTTKFVESTITFDDLSKMTSSTTEKQIWEENGLVVEYHKNNYSNNLAEYAKPVRFYKGTKVSITALNPITNIAFDANTDAYATTLASTLSASATSDKVSIDLDGTSSTYEFELTEGQVRIDAITVTCEVKGEAGTEDVVTAALFDNISILFGATVETSLFETFASVKAGVMFSAGDTLDVSNAVEKEVETLVENNGVYSVGAVLEVFADGEVVTDETKENLSKNVTAAVYFVLDGETVILEPKTYSVETMVDHYVTNAASLGIEDQYTIDALKALQAYIAA